MLKLITRSDIANYRQISKTSNDDKLNELILDAQMLDLQPLLGERLYNKILSNPSDYTELLEGGSYNYQNASYTNYGLKMVLAYYAYARYVMFGSAIDTPFSLTEKLNPDSRPVETSSKKTTWHLNRESASQIWENVSNYLIRTKHPDFNNCHSSAPVKSFRIRKIG